MQFELFLTKLDRACHDGHHDQLLARVGMEWGRAALATEGRVCTTSSVL
jgi:hypothetical protein